jgi:dihydrofolate synthase/folylpolyglutamate synthase
MNEKEVIIDKLFSLQRFGIKPGLERTLELSEKVGNPHRKFPAIHIAGTNGKGSICSMLAGIFISAGYKVGLYTSPHLIDFNERISINGNPISNDDMVKISEELLSYQEEIGSTFFEITTVLAFKYFADNNVDIAIIETGMGGRFDSTNILNPLVSIISQIDLDHKEYLGNTLEEIAFEKAGIIKPNTPVIISDNHNELKAVFNEKANETNSEIHFSYENVKFENIKYNQDFTQSFDLIYDNENMKNLNLGLAGNHQHQNLSAVFFAYNLLKDKFNLTQNNFNKGLSNIIKNAKLRGRIELLNKDSETPYILDTAHNPAAIVKLIDTLKLHRPDIKKWNFVYGGMADKDINEVLQIIKPICTKLIITRPNIERAIELKDLYNISEKLGFKDIVSIEKVTDAVEEGINLRQPLVITGSFYLAGEALEKIK